MVKPHDPTHEALVRPRGIHHLTTGEKVTDPIPSGLNAHALLRRNKPSRALKVVVHVLEFRAEAQEIRNAEPRFERSSERSCFNVDSGLEEVSKYPAARFWMRASQGFQTQP